MLYLKDFSMLTREAEEDYFFKSRLNSLSPRYPFNVFRYRELPTFEFEPITIFCGGNGSGKSTILNVIADKLRLRRGAAYNRGDLFGDYVERCRYSLFPGSEIPQGSRIITSDDVFDYLLDIRYINGGVDRKRSELFGEYFDKRSTTGTDARLQSLDDYDRWRDIADAKMSKHPEPLSYVKSRVMSNVRERSNGESALLFFTEEIKENALYLLDEPENSLSAEFQLELKTFLEASMRGYRCQFVISTHSPFLLSIPGARIYDLDAMPPAPCRWTDIKNVRIYHDFFIKHDKMFDTAL